MSEGVFMGMLPEMIAGYADDKVKSHQWSSEGALAESAAAYEQMLPLGYRTDGHFFLEIFGPGGEVVGSFWYQRQRSAGVECAFIFNVQIKEQYRRRGFASQAFRALEEKLRAENITAIKLHVFGHNLSAQKLYASLGYEVTNQNMMKQL